MQHQIVAHGVKLDHPAVHAIQDVRRIALIVVDMQNVYVAEGQPLFNPYGAAIIGNIARLAVAVRSAGGTVAWTRHTTSDDPALATPAWFDAAIGAEASGALAAARPGTHGFEIVEGLPIAPEDIVIEKYRSSAFFPDHAGLHEKLKARAIDTVIVTGVLTNYCCQATARDAWMLDYRVFFVPDATACASDEIQNATLADLENMRFFDLRAAQSLIEALT